MAKSLNDILKGVNKSKVVPGSTGDDPGVDYAGKMKDERDFVAQHKTEKHEDRVGNDDKVYKGTTKKADMERHGHDPDPKAKNVYKQANEEIEQVDEVSKKLAARSYRLSNKKGDAAYDNDYSDEAMTNYVRAKRIGQHMKKKYGIDVNKKGQQDRVPTGWKVEEEQIDEVSAGLAHRAAHGAWIKADENKPPLNKSTKLSHDEFQAKAKTFDKAVRQARKFASYASKKRMSEELEEAYKCNMSEAGKMCEVHGMKACPSDEKETSATDKEPRYNGKNKEGRQLITDKKKIEEREMTAAEKKKEEKLKDKYDPSSMKASMQKQYGAEKGKKVYFAYIRKKAMNKEQADTNITTPSTIPGDTGRV